MKYTLHHWQHLVKDPKDFIVQASSTDGNDAWQPFPIGMSWQYVKVHTHGNSLQIGSHENLLLCGFSRDTDKSRRGNGPNRNTFEVILRQNGFHNQMIPYAEYFLSLPNYKFIASPEGNGIDCHRHYEALMAGCVPILERNPLVEEKYKGCPILWTTDFSEITENYLVETYAKMLDTEYDFSCLFLSSYPESVQEQIKRCGNYWLSTIHETKCTWY